MHPTAPLLGACARLTICASSHVGGQEGQEVRQVAPAHARVEPHAVMVKPRHAPCKCMRVVCACACFKGSDGGGVCVVGGKAFQPRPTNGITPHAQTRMQRNTRASNSSARPHAPVTDGAVLGPRGARPAACPTLLGHARDAVVGVHCAQSGVVSRGDKPRVGEARRPEGEDHQQRAQRRDQAAWWQVFAQP